MTMTEQQQIKQTALDMLKVQVSMQAGQLAEIDSRLLEYYQDLCDHSGVEPDDENDWHNVYELLSVLKLLRILRSYPIDVDKVRQVIRLREGEWKKKDGIWKYQKGGLLLPGTRGATHYRWMPFQVYVLAAMYGAKAWVDTEVPNGSRELLPTERNGEGGTIEDLRRLCTDFTFFAPRKTDKTGLSAYNNFLYFMLEDADSEIYCCANSQSQSRLLFDRTSQLIRQMDSQGKRIRFTATEVNWRQGQFRSSKLNALSAGGKTKDGLFAQLCCADEFGSAGYVNDKSDMGALVNVVLSSMGPRREPMMFTSTTAGTITAGPFIDKLDGMKRELLKELEYPTGSMGDGRLMSPNDRWMILPLQPDEWQMDDEYLLTSKAVRKKVNPALGIIVQNSFYESAVSDSRLDPLKKTETLTKLFNVYQTGRAKTWVVTSDKVRALQTDMRVTDCRYKDGWNVFVGMDFSSGEDLFAISYFCVNYTPGLPMEQRFLADCDAWIVETELQRSPNRPLYERWIKQGYLHVCPGETFNPDLAINHLMEKNELGINLVNFGYDPAQSKQPINTLKAWLQSLGLTADNIKSMVVPVSQSFMTMNPIIGELEHYILTPWLRFSSSPLWAWMAGNVAVVYSRDDTLRRLQKSGVHNKIDCFHALLDAIYIFDLSEGQVS